MKIYGAKVPPEAIAAAERVRDSGSHFRAADVIGRLEAAGVGVGSVRAADALLRRWKRAGLIELVGKGPYWRCSDRRSA